MTNTEKHRRLKRAVQKPELNSLSDRALARRLGVSNVFVSKHRSRYAEKPASFRASNGAVFRSRGTQSRAPAGLALMSDADIARRDAETERLIERVRSLREQLGDAREAARKRAEERDEVAHENGKLVNQVSRYQSDLAKRRRQHEHYVAKFCQKLCWILTDPDEAVETMMGGLLIGPNCTVQLSARERGIFHEMYTEIEGEAQRHFRNRWTKLGLTRTTQAEGRRAFGLKNEDLNDYVAMERDEWINAQLSENPWPWDDR